MFSVKEKQHIAKVIERALLELKHPEMPKERPDFVLNVKGKETWSWAQIEPNWKYEDKKPDVNQWNEEARDLMPDTED